MPCDFPISDSATVTWTQNPATGEWTANTSGGAGGTTSSISSTTNVDGSVTYTHNNGAGVISTWTIPAGGGGGTGTTSSVTSVTNADGSVTYTHDNGAGVTTQWTVPGPAAGGVCTVASAAGTGTQNGHFVDACATLVMPAGEDPESGFPAAGFPEWWRQGFTDGVGGSTYWIVMRDATGQNQWHEIV